MSLSLELYQQAQQHIPGGVNSPVRAFRGVGGHPLFIERADGAYLYDVEGRAYVDYVGSWGPMILGHNHPAIREAVLAAVDKGLSFGAPTRIEIEMAQTLNRLMPSLEMVRMVSSGTEATMSAIRLARAYTGRDTIIKFEGCYHGHADSLLVKAGSGALTLGVPTSPGVPADFAKHTLTLPYNQLESVRECLARMGEQIAAIIVEPVAGNMNCVPPRPGFLEGLRKLCTQHGVVLIFDEVMTGFRVALGGAQALYQVSPDLTTLGKIIGGGMPVGAFGGKAEIMQLVAPAGPMYQAGTLSGNPVAMAAGLATLEAIQQQGFYQHLSMTTSCLCGGLTDLAREAGVPFLTQQAGAMFGLFFTQAEAVSYYEEVCQCDLTAFRTFFHAMLQNGVYLAPSAYEAGFVSLAHDAKALDQTMTAAKLAFAEVAALKRS